MATINPYLNFPGNTEDAFNFYKSVFGGEFVMLQRFKETPDADKLSAEEQEKIMHVALPIGKGTILMATDALESMGQTLVNGSNFSLAIGADSEQEADSLFNRLAAGGKVEMPLQKTFWNAYFGMLTDKFGVQWMINYEYSPQYQQN
jgi:PhnB protein